jgi:hypothetical protein
VKKFEVFKTVVSLIASIGVGAVVQNAIKHTTPSDLGKLQTYTVAIGTYVLSSMICNASGKYIKAEIDDIAKKTKLVSEEEPEVVS